MCSVVVIFNQSSGIVNRVCRELITKCNPFAFSNEVVEHLAVCPDVVFVGHRRR